MIYLAAAAIAITAVLAVAALVWVSWRLIGTYLEE